MSDFRVQGEVSLDGSKFLGGMKQMELAANRTGSSMVNSLGGHLAGLFSLGAIGAFIGPLRWPVSWKTCLPEL